jgi:hypothetical protein
MRKRGRFVPAEQVLLSVRVLDSVAPVSIIIRRENIGGEK